MSAAARTQIAMLAETLGVQPDRLAHLERLDPDDLRALRTRISDALFDSHGPRFARVSKLAPFVPDALVAKVAQAIVPPLVSGRVAGALGLNHAERIEGVLSRLTPEYMADCAPYVDPRAVHVLAPKIPVAVLAPAARELMRRGAYTVAARYLADIPLDVVAELAAAVDDDIALLLTAQMIEDDDTLAAIVEVLPADRLTALIAAAEKSSAAHAGFDDVRARVGADALARAA
jgi:hypothetical protein